MIKTLLLHTILDQSIESFFNGLISTFGSINSGEYYVGMKFNKIVVGSTLSDFALFTYNFYDGIIVATDGINIIVEYNHLKKVITYCNGEIARKTQYQSCGVNDKLITSIRISSITNCI